MCNSPHMCSERSASHNCGNSINIPRIGHWRSTTEECFPTKVDHLPSALGLASAELGVTTKHPAPSAKRRSSLARHPQKIDLGINLSWKNRPTAPNSVRSPEFPADNPPSEPPWWFLVGRPWRTVPWSRRKQLPKIRSSGWTGHDATCSFEDLPTSSRSLPAAVRTCPLRTLTHPYGTNCCHLRLGMTHPQMGL